MSEKEIKVGESTEYVYTGANLSKDMEELERFRAELRRTEEAREARKIRIEREKIARAEGRTAALPLTPVTVESIAAALDRFLSFIVTPEYVLHFVQPYCQCEPAGDEYWDLCAHARDLGFHA